MDDMRLDASLAAELHAESGGERGAWLMSLALDNMLQPAEVESFDALLAQDTRLGDEWALWQAVDAKFVAAPTANPSAGFVAEFERRQLQVERRRRLWAGLSVVVAAVLLWSSLVLGLATAGAYVIVNQADWLVTLLHGVAYLSSSLQIQAAALASALTTLLSTPQVQGMLLAYAGVAALTLFAWLRFLRRSVNGSARAIVGTRIV